MTTPRIRSLVSLAAALTVTLTAGGCAGTAARPSLEAPAPANEPPPAVRFDNDSRDYVHVYLVGDRREWLLGRVGPGARANLRIPDEALAEDAGRMRLAVLVGERVTFRAGSAVRAASALPQSAAVLLSRRWTFSGNANGELIALPLGSPRGVGAPYR
jgi:hypothetical protein